MLLPGCDGMTDFTVKIPITIGAMGLGLLPVVSLPQTMRPLLSVEPVVVQFTPPAQLYEPIGPPPPYSWADIPQNQQYLGRMREQVALVPGQDSAPLCLRHPEEDYTIQPSDLMYQPMYFVNQVPPTSQLAPPQQGIINGIPASVAVVQPPPGYTAVPAMDRVIPAPASSTPAFSPAAGPPAGPPAGPASAPAPAPVEVIACTVC